MAGEADRSIGLIMPFSSTQMKALCLRAQPWTLRITFKAFCGCTGCVQCCGWGLYNLAALGNYKDKWREAQSITHPVRERGLKLGNFFFFFKAAHTPYSFHNLPPTCLHSFFFSSFFFMDDLCCIFPILPPLSVSLTLTLPICFYWSRGMEVFIYTSSAAQIAPLLLAIENATASAFQIK